MARIEEHWAQQAKQPTPPLRMVFVGGPQHGHVHRVPTIDGQPVVRDLRVPQIPDTASMYAEYPGGDDPYPLSEPALYRAQRAHSRAPLEDVSSVRWCYVWDGLWHKDRVPPDQELTNYLLDALFTAIERKEDQ